MYGADHMATLALAGKSSMSMDRPAFRQALSEPQRVELKTHLAKGLEQGGLGIGMLLDYMSEDVDDAEMEAVFQVASIWRTKPRFLASAPMRACWAAMCANKIP